MFHVCSVVCFLMVPVLIHSLKEVNQEIKLAEQERKRVIQEEKEVARRQATALENLKR